MAGNRLQRTGSIFARLNGLIRAGAVKNEDIPLWHDIYKAFPPTHEPAFTRPAIMKDIKPIFYPEDIIRAKFYKTFYITEHQDLIKPHKKSTCQKFVDKYMELEKKNSYSNEDDLFLATEDALLAEGEALTRYAEEEPPRSIIQQSSS